MYENLQLVKSFLNNYKQRAVLNGHASSWAIVPTGALQGSILGPLFLMYINDLLVDLFSNPNVLADNTLFLSYIRQKSHNLRLQ